MTDPKVNSNPDWQRREPGEASATAESEKTTDSNLRPPTSRAALLEQATKFLQDNEIRQATAERKISFLESKGLTKEEIQQLLGTSKIESTSSRQESTAPVDLRVRITMSTLETDMLTFACRIQHLCKLRYLLSYLQCQHLRHRLKAVTSPQ